MKNLQEKLNALSRLELSLLVGLITFQLTALLMLISLKAAGVNSNNDLLGECYYRANSPGKVILQSDTHVLLHFFGEGSTIKYGIRSHKSLDDNYEKVDCSNLILEDEINL